MKLHLSLLILVLLMLSACQASEPSAVASGGDAVAVATSTPAVVATNTPTTVPPTETPLPPTETPIPPTATPNPTATPTPQPSPTPARLPVPQGYHHLAYDAESELVILVPRQGNNITMLGNQTWVFDLNEQSWQMMRGGPPEGEGPLAYDAQSDRTIFFIGAQFRGNEIIADGQTWAYDANTDMWTNMEPAESPFGLLGARMVYDSESDRMILFGGWDFEHLADEPETWAYDYDTNTWTNLHPTGSPPPGENYLAMSYDPAADRVIAWRRGLNPDTGDYEYKIGVYDTNTNTWEIRDQGLGHPAAQVYSAMVYDPGSGMHILFGGLDMSEEPLDKTYGYEYASNKWKRLSFESSPSARGWHAMVYHAQAGVIVLFGGGASRNEFTNETWVCDAANREWRNLSP